MARLAQVRGYSARTCRHAAHATGVPRDDPHARAAAPRRLQQQQRPLPDALGDALQRAVLERRRLRARGGYSGSGPPLCLGLGHVLRGKSGGINAQRRALGSSRYSTFMDREVCSILSYRGADAMSMHWL